MIYLCAKYPLPYFENLICLVSVLWAYIFKASLMNGKIVGVLNVSPDSFSDGRIYTRDELRWAIKQLIHDWADIIDVGAESTAPGSLSISEDEEFGRLRDFFEIMHEFREEVIFSLDTKKSTIAERWIECGVGIINDVSGGRNDPEIIDIIAQNPSVSYVCMYCKNTHGHADRDSSKNPADIITTITSFFDERLASLYASGVSEKQIILDTGMGAFISTDPMDSVRVLQSIPLFLSRYHLPLLVGTSRKWFLSELSTDRWPEDRLASSVVSSLYALEQWASYVRVHDIHEMRQAIQVWKALHTSTLLV